MRLSTSLPYPLSIPYNLKPHLTSTPNSYKQLCGLADTRKLVLAHMAFHLALLKVSLIYE